MIQQIRKFVLTCDSCKATAVIESHCNSPFYEEYPKDWTQPVIHDCGMTGYSRRLDLCPTCTERETKGPTSENSRG